MLEAPGVPLSQKGTQQISEKIGVSNLFAYKSYLQFQNGPSQQRYPKLHKFPTLYTYIQSPSWLGLQVTLDKPSIIPKNSVKNVPIVSKLLQPF